MLKLLRPCFVDGLLAPTNEQQEKYAKWLHVYAKAYTMMPARMAILVDKWNMETTPQYDIFEPGYLQKAFEVFPGWGRLVFGDQEWIALGGTIPEADDALTSLFRKHNLLHGDTHLHPRFHSELCPPDFTSKSRPRRPTYYYYAKKQVWTIGRIPSTMLNFIASKTGKAKGNNIAFQLQTDQDHASKLFKNIVNNSGGVAIGPLEYCGHGNVILHRKRKISVAVHGDPTISAWDFQRHIQGLHRRKNHLDVRGGAKATMPSKYGTTLANSLQALHAARKAHFDETDDELDADSDERQGDMSPLDTLDMDDDYTLTPSSDGTFTPSSDDLTLVDGEVDMEKPSERPSKKVRLSIDKALALSLSSSLGVIGGRQTRTQTRNQRQ
ncbi:hypothetical protein HGRIS_004172 [Hohenbuehelia grisea]|uniref:BRCT domain-containing protein n=1 Tax=Hohenbuehelia grisea TaxID=104357 RepID=A0ABR3JID8_9AGAR